MRFPGISQRDPNYYDFWNEHETQEKVAAAVADFWETHIKGKWEQTQGDCTSQSVHCVPASLTKPSASVRQRSSDALRVN